MEHGRRLRAAQGHFCSRDAREGRDEISARGRPSESPPRRRKLLLRTETQKEEKHWLRFAIPGDSSLSRWSSPLRSGSARRSSHTAPPPARSPHASISSATSTT